MSEAKSLVIKIKKISSKSYCVQTEAHLPQQKQQNNPKVRKSN